MGYYDTPSFFWVYNMYIVTQKTAAKQLWR